MTQQILKCRQGLDLLLRRPKDPKYPLRHIAWTDDLTIQLPIRKTKTQFGSIQPTTLINQFINSVKKHGNKPALSQKINGKWETINYLQYYNNCIQFAKSLIAYQFPQFTSVSVIGFNSPQWAITFYGSMFARSITTGIYTTNSQQVCSYIAQNSQCKLVIAQNMLYANKYLQFLQNGKIQLIIIYNDSKANLTQYKGKIIQWKDFMKKGQGIQTKLVQERMNKIKPGNCATLAYTSGTTGMPKGVMLSHDNLTWTKKAMDAYYQVGQIHIRLVSYLPLSHVAGLFVDLVTSLMSGYHVFFAQPDALQGSLIQTLKQVRPIAFFSVPRVWQKLYQKMQQISKQNSWLIQKLATWAKSIGPQGTVQQIRKKQTTLSYKLAKLLIFNKIKKQLGLDQCIYFLFGAAPLDPQIRHYFLSLGFFLINTYGMSQSTGPQNFSNRTIFNYKNIQSMRQAGSSIPGTQIKISKQNPQQQDGQICYRGRNIFMGYFRNPDETQTVIDAQGYLHSGDMGKINQDNVLFITGRVKQLIITSGGQNIPPLLIQNQIKSALPFISNVMVIGDKRNYLTCLITIKQDPPGSGKLQNNSKDYLKSKQCDINTVQQLIKHPNINKIIKQGLKQANSKAISRAQNVHHFYILSEDFSIQNGTLTPTLKLKRKFTEKKFQLEINSLYVQPKL